MFDYMKYERKVLFNPRIRCVRIASSLLPSDKIFTVIDFCEDYYKRNETIPLEVQNKYKRTTPSYNTKTFKIYVEPGQPIQKEFVDPNFDDFAIKRKDSRKVFSLKKNQYKQRKDEFTQQRGANINLKGKEPEDNVEYYD